ncbi:hypothetical protein BT96DRAFT_982946 [Gymnopus androsaceus JB14]|uniref:Mid2 domain-containing protein n=1 Tax=Gymnopus androsaceus JB14 TaxID=1447944 RepID=A0A6A4IKM4_9AGAR|nr:hypothetical protein BT96DRAFT_982946 [Gymnopus androsaceus JB14]
MAFKVMICFLVIALSVGVGNARVLARQSNAVSVDGLSMAPSEAPGLEQPTSAISVDGLSMAPLETPGGPQPEEPPAISVDGLSMASLETPSLQQPTSAGLATETASAASSDSHSGAIAGGVVAAFVVAVVAGVLLLRYRSKRSPNHWRNRVQRGAGPLGDRWHKLDIKSDIVSTANPVLDDHKSPIASPVTAKFSTPLMHPLGVPRLPAENIEMQTSWDGY